MPCTFCAAGRVIRTGEIGTALRKRAQNRNPQAANGIRVTVKRVLSRLG